MKKELTTVEWRGANQRDKSGEKMSRDKGSSQEEKMGLERSRADYREVARSRERQSKRKKSRIQGQERS